jgi:hypothetical protein
MNRRFPRVLASGGLVVLLALSSSPAPVLAGPESSITASFNGPPDPTVGDSRGGVLSFSEAGSGTPAAGGAPVDPCYNGNYHLRGSVPVPPWGIDAGPAAGVVNIPTWFWTTGYSGGIIKSRTVEVTRHVCNNGVPQDLDYTAEVDLWPSTWTWTWGDDPRDTETGQCPDLTNPNSQFDLALADWQWVEDLLDLVPVPNSCTQWVMGQKDQPFRTHTYQASSAGTNRGFVVALDIQFKGQIGLGNGDPSDPRHWISLDSVMHDPIPVQHASTYLPVREMESILVPAPGT